MSDLAGDARAVVRNSDPDPTFRKRLGRYLDFSVSTRKRVDRIFCERLERPFEKHRIALYDKLALMR